MNGRWGSVFASSPGLSTSSVKPLLREVHRARGQLVGALFALELPLFLLGALLHLQFAETLALQLFWTGLVPALRADLHHVQQHEDQRYQ